jgi:alcohol dehydrogenase
MVGAYVAYTGINDAIFTINLPYVKFGFGSSKEVGFEAKRLGLKKVLLVVGKRLSQTKLFEEIKSLIENEGITVYSTDKVHIEPEDEALIEAYREIKNLEIDGFIALGGGSTIDTAKVLNLLYTYPSDLFDYINRPVGKGLFPPGPLKPLIAIPTTAGTGSESTSVAVIDILKLKVKTGISNPYLKPTVALIDPLTTVTMPPMVTASTGLDVLNHAIESLTARPYTARPAYKNPLERPVYAGSTPLADVFGLKAVEWVHKYLRRAVANPYDMEARYYMMLAASIAGIGFGHAGVHVPHAMAYPIAGMIRRWYPEDYEFGYPITPHGISTAIPAISSLKYLASYNHEKFALICEVLGFDVKGLTPVEIGKVIGEYYIKLLEDLKVPTNLRELDYSSSDLEALINGTLAQQRLLSLAPKNITKKDLEKIFLELL